MSFLEFVLVGMRHNDVRPQAACGYNFYLLLPEPENPHDAKAVRVLGGARLDGEWRMLGHVARGSQAALPPLPTTGSVFESYVAYLDTPNAARIRVFREIVSPPGRTESPRW